MISTGAVRRAIHPFLLKLWLKHAKNRELRAEACGLTLTVCPTVFHPRFFGSSTIFARFIETLDLRGRRFLDMGTGSGIIGLVAARQGAEVIAVDINPAAVRAASVNADAARLRMDCRVSDLFQALATEQFDVIAWNPPFFAKPAADIAENALFAGENHHVIRRFAAQARRHLTPGGAIYMIFSGDGDLTGMKSMFETAGFSMKPAKSERWGLAELMIVFEIR